MFYEIFWLADQKKEAVVTAEIAICSYEVSTSDGTTRRNKRDLIMSQTILLLLRPRFNP